ncbi:nicotinate phosphoribosyltransferase [Crepidotus variabilis]|uniref:Nicotinate phosphoribosyltransferase n=1 Tax=Crepidotus variabilis TaxID=179855 RepID=A0A9P6JK68_9AGAR|nr:nicotinate phosphoribosyltransferase [Crepidotus variabilis]
MSTSLDDIAVPFSILDTDLYKLTMQQAVLQQYPNLGVTYRFKNRNTSALFSRHCVERFRTAVSTFATIQLTKDEREWLAKSCPYFTPEYLDYLESYRFKPEQVKIKYTSLTDDKLQGNLDIDIAGPWVETILWEVPLMACLSECYFQTVFTDWNYDGQEELAYAKAKTLLQAGCRVSEFGTRRRRSFKTQDIVVGAFARASRDVASSGGLSGTSNVYLAQKYDLSPIGTIAHEWFMGIGAMQGYEHANVTALKQWEKIYGSNPSALVALTDTFTTTAFVKDLYADPELAHTWTGLRQDSGDPFAFAPRFKEVYQSLHIPFEDKVLIFSDSLNVEKCLGLKSQCDELGFAKVSFGIGTFLTNDFKFASTGEKSKALNIVIKLASAGGNPCVKLSDDLTKNTGDLETVQHIKKIYGL